MNRRFLLAVIMVLAVALSVGTIYASDVNTTETYTVSQDDMYIAVYNSDVDNDSSNDNILKSDNSDILSTDSESNSLLKSDNNAEVLTASKTVDKSKTITSKDVTKYYKGSKKYTATFLDINGNPLKNTNVKITLNGVSYTKKTNTNGVASLAVNLKPGTYKVVANNPKTGYKLTNTFKVLSTISAKDISKVYTDGRKFYATFLKSTGKVLANKNIKFKLNGKTFTKKTNSKGVASLSLVSLKVGTHKITSYNTDGLTKTKTIKVVKSTTSSLTASDYTFLKSDSKTIKVKLLNKFGYAPGAGKVITFKVNGKSYTVKTNSKGIASLKLPSLKNGVYTVNYKFAGNAFYKASSAKSKVTILPSKTPTFTVKSTTTFGYGAGTSFELALTSGSVALANKNVTLKVDGKEYTKNTDSKGIISLPIDLAVGKHTITYTNEADSKVDSKTESTVIKVVKRTASSLTWKSSTTFDQGKQSFSVLLLDSSKKPISGETVKLVANSKTYTATTSSTGYATFSVSLSNTGKYKVSYSFDGDNLNAKSSGSKTVTIEKADAISLKNIVSAASSLKTYYEKNKKFPNTVTAGGISFTIPEFLYLMSQAISQIDSSDTKDIAYLKGVTAPSSPSGDDISTDLKLANYVKTAKSVSTYISSNKKAPNYASSTAGKIIYSEVVDAFSRVLAFYDSNDRLPGYVTVIYSSTGSSQSGNGLNEKNTISDLTAYLKSSKNCQVNNSAIKKVVDSLTKNLKSDSAKAKAIFEYVRDTLSYSFYYSTAHGAVGTLSAKSGNCVDHSHLLVAMFRTAGMAARYVHGTCKFSSGSTYGHVWTQVLIDGKWTVADATSSRNSLGKVSNWNTKSFSLKGIYSGISF